MGRDEATQLLNNLVNDPANLAALGYESVDLTAFFDRPGNVAIGNEDGVALFAETEPGIYEGHYLFASNTRGKDALQMARDMVSRLFTLHDASLIVGNVPADYKASRLFTRALGFTPVGASVDSEGRSCVRYVLERASWEALSAESSAA